VTCIALSPNYVVDGLVFAGTLEDGVYYSDDWGQHWKSANFGLLDKSVFLPFLSPNFPHDGIIFAGTDSGVFRSNTAANHGVKRTSL
jgi:hypothetical protein